MAVAKWNLLPAFGARTSYALHLLFAHFSSPELLSPSKESSWDVEK